MTKNQMKKVNNGFLKKWFIISLSGWTLVIILLLVIILNMRNKAINDIAVKECKTDFSKDVQYRLWATKHGGVYVPMTEDTPPNPYLSHIPERDIVTPSGKKLTLINPAYMTRQVFELGKERFNFKGHITSLNPIRKENAPDVWEREVLKSFESGVKEKIEIVNYLGEKHIRFMAPFVTEKGCLKCHASQGYKVGQVRGGISISLPWKPFQSLYWNEVKYDITGYIFVWMLGNTGLFIYYKRMKRNNREMEFLNDELKHNEEILNTLLNGIHESALLIDIEGNILVANETVDQRINQGKRNLVGKNIFEILPEEVADIRRQHLMEVIKTGKPIQFEDTRNSRIIDNYLTPIIDEGSKVSKIALVGIDITERKHSEEALVLKSEELDRYFNNSLDLLCIATTEGEFVRLNPEWEKVLGYSLKELEGKIFLDFVHPEDLQPTLAAISNLQNQEEVTSFENRYRCKDGSYRWIEWRSKALGINIYAAARDITNQKIAQDEVRQSEELFRMIFNSSPYAIAITNMQDGRYLDINSAFEKILGYTKSSVVGKTSIELGVWLNPEDREPYKQSLSKNGLIDQSEFKFRINGGKIIDTEVTARILKVGNRDVVLNIIEDITTQKQAETAILQTKEMLTKLTEQVPGVVYQYRYFPDGHSYFPYSSPGMYEIYGVTPDEVREDATPVFGRIYPDDFDFIVTSIQESARNLTLYESEFRVVLPGQGIRWRHCNAKPELLDDGSVLWHGIISDITDRKLAEAELENYRLHLEELVKTRTAQLDSINVDLKREIELKIDAERQLEAALEKEKELSKLKSQFISTASHEFRTPLTSILTSASLIKKYQQKWNHEKIEEHLDRVINSVGYLTNLMDDVISINRAESGKMVLKTEPVDFHNFCIRMIEETEPLMTENHSLILNYSSPQNTFNIDLKLLELILQNLISNALKYSPKGGKVELLINSGNSNLIISVIDSGIGIPKEDIPGLFEPFNRAGNVEDIRGSGLGLSIVKNAISLHGGTIDVESELNVGTTFSVTIPIRN